MSIIAAYRLHNQQLSQTSLQTPAAVVAWMGAIQGQDYAGAKWSLGLRLPGSTDAAVEQAISRQEIVRTWVMRGTLHLVAGVDVRWLVDLFGPRVMAQSATRYRELGLDAATFQRSHTLLVRVLAGGKQLTRKELFALLEAEGISTAGQRGIHLLQRASLEGLICQGLAERNNPSFMRLDEALPTAPTLPRDAALAELAQRYFTSRGPATVQDFAWWMGLPMADARAGFEAVKSQLIEEVIDGISYWLPTTTAPAPMAAAYAPPGFDEYLLGYKDRSAVLDPQHAWKVCPGKNGVFHPTMVLDGQVAGIWKRSFKKGQVLIDPQPFAPLSPAALAAFQAATQRFSDFLQMPLAPA